MQWNGHGVKAMEQTYLRDKDIAKRYSIGKTTVWRWTREGRLPAPIRLSSGCTRWLLSDIEALDHGLLFAQGKDTAA